MTNDDERRQANRQILERVFEAIGAGDLAALEELYTDDYVLELPYGDPPLRLEGRSKVLEYVAPQLGIFRFTLTINEVHECVDPDLLVAEYTSEGEVTTTGKPYANVYIGVCRFRDGRVRSLREFYNPAIAAAAFSPD